MSLSVGSKLGAYEVVSSLGVGGMGEVYRARDTQLNRSVAIKVLPDLFAADPDRVARFTREAQVLASLNHPNIAAIYGIEQNALVMELVEGEDLSAVIARGPLLLADARPIARQIADALEAAHEQGVIHRDLKPANIKVRADGTVKVLDFGLAKAMSPGSEDPGLHGNAGKDLANSPTLTARATQMGMVLGTAAYMSPEQARGRAVDRRADIWAFGAVLYEMLTGRRAFEGDDISITLANVLKEDPKWDALPSDLSPPLTRLLRRCLEKDPKRRLSAIGDARLELDEPESAAGAPGDAVATPVAQSSAAKPLWRAALPWLVGAVGMVAVWLASRPAPVPSAATVRTVITLPDGLSVVRRDRGLALSPDGTQLALVLVDQRNRSQIYVRGLSRLDLRAIAGTDGATYPFWSPDGRSVGFFAQEQLKRLDLADGVVRTITGAAEGRGAAWGPDDVAVFAAADSAARIRARLYRVSMSAPGAATPVGPESTDVLVARLPTFLSSGVLYDSYDRLDPSRSSLRYLDLATGQSRPVEAASGEAHYVEPGWLASIHDAMVTVRPFDARVPSASGAPSVVAPGVAEDVLRGTGHVSFARNAGNTFAYLQASPVSQKQLTWMAADGQPAASIGDAAPFTEVALAPDGRRAVVGIANQAGAFRPQLWMVDLTTGLRAPFTGPQDGGGNAIWSPDGTRVAYTGVDGRLVVRPADGTGAPVVSGDPTENHTPYAWMADGVTLVVGNYRGLRGIDLALMPAAGGETRIFVESEASEAGATISPDGRWLAYISTETGRQELYVTTFPKPGQRWPVTRSGVFGTGPDAVAWTPEGDSLVYIGLDDRLTRVALNLRGDRVQVGDTRPLLGGRALTGSVGWIAPVGGRYLIASPLPGQQLQQSIVLVTNWQNEIRK